MSFIRKLSAAAAVFLALVFSPAALFWTSATGATEPKGQGGLRLTTALRQQLRGLKSLHGPALEEGSLRGKVVAVTFFASWCPPCRVELAHLKKLRAARHGRGFEVVAINFFEAFDGFSNSARLAEFLKQTSPGFPVLKGDQAVSRRFGTIRRIPALFVFDRSGNSVLRFSNERNGPSTVFDTGKLEALVARLLEGES